ncbi:RidA family protein [Plantactinospora sp. S1510]|uniref:RidA family protein n=1 Tax=Plantactinospora alkalitolerans TaxID=2789879 RepID=A0ABS0GTX8_9ACTN|nr:RidA family protein [Plantactinospora alkalitolerans]MBF9129641.1 RidA family protein [Plantactinospora alkalitolerans]
MIERFHPEGLPTPPVPLSSATKAGDFVFVSGQVATDHENNVFVGDFTREVESTLDNVEAVLASAGARPDQIVKIGAYLSNAILFAPFNEVYRRRFPQAPPARTTVVVDFGHPNVRVEIEAIAYLG